MDEQDVVVAVTGEIDDANAKVVVASQRAARLVLAGPLDEVGEPAPARELHLHSGARIDGVLQAVAVHVCEVKVSPVYRSRGRSGTGD